MHKSMYSIWDNGLTCFKTNARYHNLYTRKTKEKLLFLFVCSVYSVTGWILKERKSCTGHTEEIHRSQR